MTTNITLTEDEFDVRYPLISNHFNPQASCGFGDAGGCLFETYGDELDFVRQQDPRAAWTLIDGDLNLVSGRHYRQPCLLFDQHRTCPAGRAYRGSLARPLPAHAQHAHAA